MSAFKKIELVKYYFSAYLIVALLITLLITIIDGEWTVRMLIINFSIWGIIWLVSMFGFPLFITSANPEYLATTPYLALLGYVIIAVVYFITYRIHLADVKRRTTKKLTFSKVLDLYFPLEQPKKPIETSEEL